MRMLRLFVLFALVCPAFAQAQTTPAPAEAAPAKAAPAKTPRAAAPPAKAPGEAAAPAKAPSEAAAPAKAPRAAAPAKAAPTATKAPSASPTAAEVAPVTEPAPLAPAAPPGAFPQQAPPPPPVVQQQQQPVQPGPLPAPYYGYGYGYTPPPVADPGRAQALTELQSLDQRIASVRTKQKQHSIVAPSVMTAAGYGLALGLGVVAVLEWAVAEDIRNGNCADSRDRFDRSDSHCDVNNDGFVDNDDRRTARTMARTFGAISALGAGLGIAGTVLLLKRLSKRRVFAPELRELGVRRGQLLQQLRYGGSYSQNGMQLSISGRF